MNNDEIEQRSSVNEQLTKATGEALSSGTKRVPEAVPGLVSVVLPTYKRSQFLERSIQSVLDQSYGSWELIVVDDNEPDTRFRIDTERFMRRYESDPRISYVTHARNSGGGAARNTGIRSSRGEYVAFLDDDDEWAADKLEKQVASMCSSPDSTAMVYSGFRKVFLEIGTVNIELPDPGGHTLESLLYRNTIGTTSTILCRRDPLLEVGMFDESLPSRQDVDLYVRLARKYDFAFVNEPLVTWYRHSEGSIGTNRKRAIEAHTIFLDKYRAELVRYPDAYRHRLFTLGQLMLREGMLEEARDVLVEAWRLYPFHTECLAYLLLANPLGFRFYQAALHLRSRNRTFPVTVKGVC